MNSGPAFWSFQAGSQYSFNDSAYYVWNVNPVTSNGNTSAVTLKNNGNIVFNQSGYYRIDWIYSYPGVNNMEMCITPYVDNAFDNGTLYGLAKMNSSIYEGSLGSTFYINGNTAVVSCLKNSGSNNALPNNSK